MNMGNLYQNVIRPYICQTEQNPDLTAAKIDGQVYSYAQLAQRVAPIMNELDAMSVERIGVLMRPDLSACAALLAGLCCGVTVAPLPPHLGDAEKDKVVEALQLPQVLTPERMHYYFRMTFEDALNRIDNGLYNIQDEQLVCVQCLSGNDGEWRFAKVFAKDFPVMRPFSLHSVFQKLTPDLPEICSIF